MEEHGGPRGMFEQLQRKASIESKLPTKKPRMAGKRLFRALMRTVIQNMRWLADVGDEELGESAARNVQVIKQRRQHKALLTLQDKVTMRQDPHWRTQEEKERLYTILRSMKCFTQFPPEVQKKMASYLYFEYIGPNRIIVRQGHEATCMYFIMEGEVSIWQDSYDPVDKKMVCQQIGSMGPGDKFGEVALLHGMPRTATVISVTVCEMLGLHKDDFAHVLRNTLQHQWDLCREAMSRFTYFDRWGDVLTRECCILSRIQKYATDDTIVGDNQGLMTHTYFILSGQCRVVEVLVVEVHSMGPKLLYHLPDNNVTEKMLPAGHKLQKHFLQVCLLNELHCFGIGEDLTDRRVVAITDVECLILPRDWLMQNNIDNLWCRVRLFVERRYPTKQQVFRTFVKNRNLIDLKRHLTKIDTTRVSGTTRHEVPYSLRLQDNNDYYRSGY